MRGSRVRFPAGDTNLADMALKFTERYDVQNTENSVRWGALPLLTAMDVLYMHPELDNSAQNIVVTCASTRKPAT